MGPSIVESMELCPLGPTVSAKYLYREGGGGPKSLSRIKKVYYLNVTAKIIVC